ncbi:MAG: 30S ribosomal protein S12 methylthiotransferase RimO [Firmicutes bacterium]|nr:30S ribosomal protein S12 methylthiotransferase RimO [Bacillota bacterium]
MSIKVGMVSLGCPKNQVDAELMLAKLAEAGYQLTPNESEADVVIINTCGFIEDAKREAIDNILDVAANKQYGNLRGLIVTGCLAERYRDEVAKEFPEVDAVVGIGKNDDIADIVGRVCNGERVVCFGDKTDAPLEGDRVMTTPPYTAYLRVADGCDNCCTYCTIPSIRGSFRSRPMDSVVAEARRLAGSGVKELVVIAQDTTNYGTDLCGHSLLPQLLDELCAIDGIEWIRTLYTYPDRITDELLDTVARQPKICNYFDIPLQHVNGEILSRMNRTGDRESLTALIGKIRSVLPDAVLRTTLITGFPAESEEQFAELCEFVKEVRFDRLGCFAYSAEEGTPAAGFDGQIAQEVKERRAEVIMNSQLRIIEEKNRQRIGTAVEVLVEGYDSYIKCCYGRTRGDAPDIDAKVFFMPADKRPLAGDIVTVMINDTIEYDLLGEQI